MSDPIESKMRDLEILLKWMRSTYQSIPEDVLVALVNVTQEQQAQLDESLNRVLH